MDLSKRVQAVGRATWAAMIICGFVAGIGIGGLLLLYVAVELIRLVRSARTQVDPPNLWASILLAAVCGVTSVVAGVVNLADGPPTVSLVLAGVSLAVIPLALERYVEAMTQWCEGNGWSPAAKFRHAHGPAVASAVGGIASAALLTFGRPDSESNVTIAGVGVDLPGPTVLQLVLIGVFGIALLITAVRVSRAHSELRAGFDKASETAIPGFSAPDTPATLS